MTMALHPHPALGQPISRQEGALISVAVAVIVFLLSTFGYSLIMTLDPGRLKEEGNMHFKNGEYEEAEDYYTQAIQKGAPDRAKIFTNRATTRLKLQDWQGAVNDAEAAINLHGAKSRNAIKAYYYLAQAQLKMHHPNEALSTARTGYKIAYENEDPNVGPLANTILEAKKAKWAILERNRLWAANDVLRQIEELLEEKKNKALDEIDQKFKNRAIGLVGREEEQQATEADYKETLKITRENFAKSNPEELKERVVPDYLVDSITFGIMQDPVVTKTGRSYERSALLEHLTRSGTDPISREPIRKDELISNGALREACEDFISHNQWALDW